MIGVIDYQAGNLRSVETALHHLGISFRVTDDPDGLGAFDRLLFPGVGAAGQAMTVLRTRGLDRAVPDWLDRGRPMLGICIGMQVALEHSEESDTRCIGLVPGRVRHFPEQPELKVPHMGWNEVHHSGHWLFQEIPDGSTFYFVHSYYPEPGELVESIGSTVYGLRFTAALEHGNFLATQFHPEKSGEHGLRLLSNFAKGG